MRKVLIRYNSRLMNFGQQVDLSGMRERDENWLDLHRHRFVRHIVDQLEDDGYTTHESVVAAFIEVLRIDDGPSLFPVAHFRFPKLMPDIDDQVMLIGGPAHGRLMTVSDMPASKRVDVEVLPPYMIGDAPLPSHVPAVTSFSRAYEFVGLNVATGVWEWHDVETLGE